MQVNAKLEEKDKALQNVSRTENHTLYTLVCCLQVFLAPPLGFADSGDLERAIAPKIFWPLPRNSKIDVRGQS